MAGPSTTRTSREYITPVPPQMRTGESWYSGTADAIYQNLFLLERSGAEYVLILSGDHIYRMDYAAMLQRHHDSEADVTVACLTVDLEQARAFGVMTVDAQDRVVSFDEKPEQPQGMPDDPGHVLASMGVYVFSMKLLAALLHDDHDTDSGHDFGKDILPSIVRTHQVTAYRFGGPSGRVTADRYWRDVGTHRCVLRSEHGSAQAPAADRLVSGGLADPNLRGATSSGAQRAWPIGS